MKKLLIATTNPGKLAEIKFYLKDLPLQLLSLKDVKITEKPEENHPTFLLNAKHKALFYSRKSGLPALADDGGLEIDYLHGAPGVKSRRWTSGNDDATDQEIINYTLKKLAKVPISRRTAKLVTTLVLALPNGKTYSVGGEIKGIIAKEAHPTIIPGFPYRSLLYFPAIKKYYHSEEMTKEEMKKYNHRGKALLKLIKIMYKYVIC